MEKTIKDHLIESFDDVGRVNQKKFKSKLLDLGREPRVRRAAIEAVEDSLDLADLMINTFTSREAPSVAVDILKAIGCNEQADDLLKAFTVSGHSVETTPACSQAPSKASSRTDHLQADEHFIDRNRTALINRVNGVDSILDELLQMNIINKEDYCDIRAETTRQKKMRALYDGPLESAGRAGKDALYEALKKKQTHLIEDLEK